MTWARPRSSCGPRATAANTVEVRVLTSLGNTVDEISPASELPTGNSIEELCAGRIDASILIVGHPNAAVGSALAGCGATLVPVRGPRSTRC